VELAPARHDRQLPHTESCTMTPSGKSQELPTSETRGLPLARMWIVEVQDFHAALESAGEILVAGSAA